MCPLQFTSSDQDSWVLQEICDGEQNALVTEAQVV